MKTNKTIAKKNKTETKATSKRESIPFHPLGYSVPEPNFSIVLPGGCNAKCAFCFEGACKKPIPVREYVLALDKALHALPDEFTSVSITGGEPTISKYLKPVLTVLALHSDRIKKIVMTTNGTNLLSALPSMRGVVNHLNLSMHHYDPVANRTIFGGAYDLTHGTIQHLIDASNRIGIDVTANCVFNIKHSSKFFGEYCVTARSLGFSAVHFRKENGNLKVPKNWTTAFGDYKVTGTGGCPVCRTTWIRAYGMPVALKTSVLEPDSVLDSTTIHELIFLADGKLYSDWAGTRGINLKAGSAWDALADEIDECESKKLNLNVTKPPKSQTKYKGVTIPRRPMNKATGRTVHLFGTYGGGCGRSTGCGASSFSAPSGRGCGYGYGSIGGCR